MSDCYLPQVGGIEMQVHDLAVNLAALGHDVQVITPIAGPTQVDGIRVHRLDVPLLPLNVPFTPKTFRIVSGLLAAEGVDVAHFHGGIVSPLAYGSAYSCQRAGIPTVVTVHCLWSYVTPVFAGLDTLFRWRDWDAVLSAVSSVAAEPIQQICGPDRDVIVLPNGIDSSLWDVEAIRASVAERGSGPGADGTVTIVSVMRLAPRKRPMHLLKMVKRLAEQVPEVPFRLVVVGDGPERASLERYVAANHLGHVVHLVGRRTREEIRRIFAHSDVFVAPANLESFGLAALEARCAGLPVVAKYRTGIREFVEHGREGLLARTDRDMVDQLARLLRDSELRRVIGKHNREVPAPVEWSTVTEMNLAAYRAAMAGETRRPALVTSRASR